MLIEETLDKLNAMKIGAMADACRLQMQTDEAAALGFEERFGFLVDAEWTAREQRTLGSGASTPPSCATRRHSRPSTSPTRDVSSASRSSRSAPAPGSPSATTYS